MDKFEKVLESLENKLERILNSYIFPPAYPNRFTFNTKEHANDKNFNDGETRKGLLTERIFFEKTVKIINEDLTVKKEFFLIQLDGIKKNQLFENRKTPDLMLFYGKYIFLVDFKFKLTDSNINKSIKQCQTLEEILNNIKMFESLKFNYICCYKEACSIDSINEKPIKLIKFDDYSNWNYNSFKEKLKNFQANEESNLKSIKQLKCFFIFLWDELNYNHDQKLDDQSSKIITKCNNDEVLIKEQYLILNGPAGSGKTVLMMEKIANTIQSLPSNHSLIMIYSCLTEVADSISKVLKKINKDNLKKQTNQFQVVPRFYKYLYLKENEVRDSLEKNNIKVVFIHISEKSNSYILIKHKDGYEACKDIFFNTFPREYRLLLNILENLKFNELKNMLLFYVDKIDELFYHVGELLTCIKHLFLKNNPSVEAKSSVKKCYDQFIKKAEEEDSKFYNYRFNKDKPDKIRLMQIFKAEIEFEVEINKLIKDFEGNNSELKNLLKHYNLDKIENLLELMRDNLFRSTSKDLFRLFLEFLNPKEIEYINKIEEKEPERFIDEIKNILRWYSFKKISRILDQLIKDNKINNSNWSQIVKIINDLNESKFENFNEEHLKLLDIREIEICSESILEKLFKNVIFLSYRSILNHLYTLNSINGTLFNNYEFHLFIDDSMGCLNQTKRNPKDKFDLEKFKKPINTIWLTFDVYQMHYFTLEKTKIFPGLETNFKIFNLNKVYRCTSEIFKIYFKFYEKYRKTFPIGLEPSDNQNDIFFKCFECFDNSIQGDEDAKRQYLSIKPRDEKQEQIDQATILDITFQEFFKKLINFNQNVNCDQFLGGIYLQYKCEPNSDNILEKIDSLLKDYQDFFKKKEIGIIIDGSKYIYKELDKNPGYKADLQNTKNLRKSLYHNLNNKIKTEKRYKLIEIIKFDDSRNIFSKEYPFVIYIFPGILGYIHNCNRSDNNESFRFDSYFGVSRATSLLIILYVQCEECKKKEAESLNDFAKYILRYKDNFADVNELADNLDNYKFINDFLNNQSTWDKEINLNLNNLYQAIVLLYKRVDPKLIRKDSCSSELLSLIVNNNPNIGGKGTLEPHNLEELKEILNKSKENNRATLDIATPDNNMPGLETFEEANENLYKDHMNAGDSNNNSNVDVEGKLDGDQIDNNNQPTQ